MAWKWAILLRVTGVRLPLGMVTRFYYQGSLTGIFLPSSIGGDLLRATWVAQASGVKHGVFASLVMEKLVGFVSAVVWAILGAGVLAGFYYGELMWLWVPLGSGGAGRGRLVGFVLLAAPSGAQLRARRARSLQGEARARAGASPLRGLFSTSPAPRGRSPATSCSPWPSTPLQMMVFLLVTRSLDDRGQPVLLLAMTGVQFLVFRIPISPDGWGIGELSAIGLFGLIGISSEAAFSMMFLNHVLTTTACLPGLWFLLQGRRSASAVT